MLILNCHIKRILFEIVKIFLQPEGQRHFILIKHARTLNKKPKECGKKFWWFNWAFYRVFSTPEVLLTRTPLTLITTINQLQLAGTRGYPSNKTAKIVSCKLLWLHIYIFRNLNVFYAWCVQWEVILSNFNKKEWYVVLARIHVGSVWTEN